MEEERRKWKRYKELFRLEIGENKIIVISRRSDDKISMAHQIKVEDEVGNYKYYFLKNAFIFHSDKIFEEFRKGIQEINLKT